MFSTSSSDSALTRRRPIRIAPSVLAWDLGDLQTAIRIADEGKADQVHLDVIDGHFAPNITFGPGTVRSLRKLTGLKFDTHLMISEPEKYAARFLEAGSDLLTFHAEVLNPGRFDALYSLVHTKGKEIGLAIKPRTPFPSWALERLDKLSCVLVMTVEPGFSGQTMDVSVFPKLEETARKLMEKADGRNTDIEVDGGVEPENVLEVVKRGGNVLVAGAGVYGKRNPVAAIQALREKALECQ
jgi:ribulose-phosphate 3-epimerase